MAVTTLPVCWSAERVADAITPLAKVSEEKSGYFLATHAPIKHIIGEKGFVLHESGTLREAELYRQIVEGWEHRQPGRDLSVLVWGEAGTGKSHLINWLKLRLDADRMSGTYSDVVTVLVRRKSGSLKDALTQLIEQLGGTFGRYLQPVRDALAKLSNETARQQLRQAIALELGPRRKDRGRQSLVEINRHLKHLADAFESRGFGRWLTKSGSVIAQTVSLLTEQSELAERESRPRFQADDFKALSNADRDLKDNIADVIHLVDELVSSDKLRSLAANLINEAMDDAVGELTGLSGGNLNRIFEQIRQELLAENKRLALFIEDVSVMSVLDLEVVKAVEPKGDASMCPLLAVMGVTDTGMSRLRDNDRQRVTHVASLGREAIGQWRSDAAGLAEFTARYLNAARLSAAQVEKIASHRRETGGDVSSSFCTECSFRTQCHQSFGKVTLEGVDIGMYPFGMHAPSRLLEHLKINEQLGITQTPRGFLINVVQPILGDAAAIEDKEFPRSESLTQITKSDPRFWSDFTHQYCGGWQESDIRRARMLAQFWIRPDITSAEEAAAALDSYRPALNLPLFSKKVRRPSTEELPSVVKPPEAPKAKARGSSSALDKLLQNLSDWIGGEKLKDDKKIREWLAQLVRDSIRWDDFRTPPRSVWQKLLGGDADAKDKYAFIEVHDQLSRVATRKFFVKFPRDEETKRLIEALARFEFLGKNSWSFENGELHKRVVARWIRAHEQELAASFQPPVDVSPALAVEVAISMLAVAAVIRERKTLPENQMDLVATLLKPLDEGRDKIIPFSIRSDDWRAATREDPKLSQEDGRVVALTKRWQELAESLYNRHHDLLRFVREELDVPQARDGGINFIDPRPILALGQLLRTAISITPLADRYFSGFWESRFTVLLPARKYADLPAVLTEERGEIAKIITSVKQLLLEWGYDGLESKEGIKAFLSDLSTVIEAKKQSGVVVHDPEFDTLYRSHALSKRAEMWGRALSEAETTVQSSDPIEMLVFDPRLILDLHAAFRVLNNYLAQLDKEVTRSEEDLIVDGDPKVVEGDLLSSLDRIAGTLQGGDDDQAAELEEQA